MFSNVFSAGKEIANKITNKFLNLSDVEIKIKEATNDDKWGPNGSLMKEISDETYSTASFQDVMTFLWYRIFSERPLNNKRIYKGLVLLSYLIINGSNFVAVSCKSHLSDIMKLKSYNDANGVADLSIRRKAEDICELLSDAQKLSEERNRAKNYQTRYYSSETTGGAINSSDSRIPKAQHLGDIDDWNPESKSIPNFIGESFMNFVNTLTQNISGPPPTETHDNFDIPSMDNGVDEIGERNQTNMTSSKAEKSNIPTKSDIIVKSKRIEGIERNFVSGHSTKVIPEVPIIDFSEPIANISATKTTMTISSEFSNCPSMTDNDFDAEFGNLRGWDNCHGHQSQTVSKVNDFNPDFDNFIEINRVNVNNNNDHFVAPVSMTGTGIISHAAPPHLKSENQTIINNNNTKTPVMNTETSTISQSSPSKSEKKFSATWNELDSLNIDLNNLCGRKHLFSKS